MNYHTTRLGISRAITLVVCLWVAESAVAGVVQFSYPPDAQSYEIDLGIPGASIEAVWLTASGTRTSGLSRCVDCRSEIEPCSYTDITTVAHLRLISTAPVGLDTEWYVGDSFALTDSPVYCHNYFPASCPLVLPDGKCRIQLAPVSNVSYDMCGFFSNDLDVDIQHVTQPFITFDSPPIITVVYRDPTPNEASPWGHVKALYR